MISVKIFMCFLTVAVARERGRHHHKSHRHLPIANILKSNDKFFVKFSETTQKVVNGIFESLNLSQQFTKETKIKLLLTMHFDLNNIAENNFQLFDVLRNASAVEVDNKPISQKRINEFILGILNDEEFRAYSKTNDKNVKTIQNTSTTKRISSEFADNKEFKKFIGGFLGKLKRLTIDDLFQRKDNIKVNTTEWVLSTTHGKNPEIWYPQPQDEEEIDDKENRRIFKGKKTKITSYPFIVSIHTWKEFTCAGSVISRNLVITAASCLQVHYNNRIFRESTTVTYVRVGSDWTSRLGELIPVQEIYFYPQYDPRTLHHNLALMRLKNKLNTPRILLDRDHLNIQPNTEIKMLGWGAKKPNEIVNPFEKLTYGILKVYHNYECKEIYSREYVTENHLCAGFKTKGSGACNRDIGGPGVIGNLLVGIVSFGAPVCGAPDAPTVFTRVRHYIDWIDHIQSLNPTKNSTVTVDSPGDKILIYYNTPSTSAYHLSHLFNNNLTQSATTPVLRADDGDRQEHSDEVFILRQIINEIKNKGDRIYDIIHKDVYDDFIDIFKPEDDSILQHPLINKTQFLIPGIHYSIHTTPSSTEPPRTEITNTTNVPTFMVQTTQHSILRINKELVQQNVSAVVLKTGDQEKNKMFISNIDT